MRYIYMKGAPRRAPQASSALKELELRVLLERLGVPLGVS